MNFFGWQYHQAIATMHDWTNLINGNMEGFMSLSVDTDL